MTRTKFCKTTYLILQQESNQMDLKNGLKTSKNCKVWSKYLLYITILSTPKFLFFFVGLASSPLVLCQNFGLSILFFKIGGSELLSNIYIYIYKSCLLGALKKHTCKLRGKMITFGLKHYFHEIWVFSLCHPVEKGAIFTSYWCHLWEMPAEAKLELQKPICILNTHYVYIKSKTKIFYWKRGMTGKSLTKKTMITAKWPL